MESQKEELKEGQSLELTRPKKGKDTQNQQNSFGPPPAPQMPNGK